MACLLEDAARAFDRAAVDDPDLTVGQFGDEAGPFGADACQTGHLSVAVAVETPGQVIGKLSRERTARTGEDKRFRGDFFLHVSTVKRRGRDGYDVRHTRPPISSL